MEGDTSKVGDNDILLSYKQDKITDLKIRRAGELQSLLGTNNEGSASSDSGIISLPTDKCIIGLSANSGYNSAGWVEIGCNGMIGMGEWNTVYLNCTTEELMSEEWRDKNIKYYEVPQYVRHLSEEGFDFSEYQYSLKDYQTFEVNNDDNSVSFNHSLVFSPHYYGYAFLSVNPKWIIDRTSSMEGISPSDVDIQYLYVSNGFTKGTYDSAHMPGMINWNYYNECALNTFLNRDFSSVRIGKCSIGLFKTGDSEYAGMYYIERKPNEILENAKLKSIDTLDL